MLPPCIHFYMLCRPWGAGCIHFHVSRPLPLASSMYAFLRVPPPLGSTMYAFLRVPPPMGRKTQRKHKTITQQMTNTNTKTTNTKHMHNNNNNHYEFQCQCVFKRCAFTSEARFIPKFLGGVFVLLMLNPYPSYPALLLQDISHAWSTDEQSNRPDVVPVL